MRVPEHLGRLASFLALALGVVLGGLLVAHFGAARVLELLLRAKWVLLPILVLHLLQIVLTAAAWRSVARPAPRLVDFIAVRWLREGVNGILPVLPVAGLLAAIRVLVRRGLALPRAVAATLADTAVELITQIPFTLLGLALLVLARGAGAVSGWIAGGLVVLCALVAALLTARRLGFARFAERGARRLGWPGHIDGLDAALAGMERARHRLAAAGMWHSLAWMLGGIEVWLALRAFGHGVGVAPALVIESLGHAVRGTAFLIPGAFGVQEGGFVLIASLFGVPPAMGLALSLLKRLRDIAFGMPSLALWLRLERRSGVARGGAGGEHSLPCLPRPGTPSG
jgi:putative membrane protein